MLPSGTADQYSDGSHDVVMLDVYNGEALLVTLGQDLAYWRIACFYNCLRGDPHWDKVVEEYCLPTSDGMSNLQDFGRIMARYRPGNQKTAIQYTTDGKTWQWLSDLMGKTIDNPPNWPVSLQK